MASQEKTLGSLKVGISRLREKGGAPETSLYDLVNGYVNQSGAPQSRDGTVLDHTLPPGTVGLCSFRGQMHVFATTAIDPGSGAYAVDILKHPDAAFTGALRAIHFAEPFLGYLYVAAEFSDGKTFHFYLEDVDAWKPNTVYLTTDRARPTVRSGLIFQPTTSNNPPAWSPNTAYEIGDVVQPTTYNGYAYELMEVDGDSASSGDTEPTWITSEGALVDEDVDNTSTDGTSTTSPTDPGVPDRYKNLPGYTQGGAFE